jgi:hypothetical protein
MSEPLKPPKHYRGQCRECGSYYQFSRFCGAKVCIGCGDHKGLARCYCGWSKTRPGEGYAELREMGEVIEPE